MRRAVGKDQTVHAELAIVRRIAKITAVNDHGLPFFIIFNQRRSPVPDEAACKRGTDETPASI